METTFRLNAEQVEQTFEACLGDDEPDIDGIVFKVRFDTQKLRDHAELVGAMLMELPEGFRMSSGGGWSFLQACDDRRGEQWTGLHQTMSKLFAMGQGLGLVKCLLPREVWDALPGGMPYYGIEDRLIASR